MQLDRFKIVTKICPPKTFNLINDELKDCIRLATEVWMDPIPVARKCPRCFSSGSRHRVSQGLIRLLMRPRYERNRTGYLREPAYNKELAWILQENRSKIRSAHVQVLFQVIHCGPQKKTLHSVTAKNNLDRVQSFSRCCNWKIMWKIKRTCTYYFNSDLFLQMTSTKRHCWQATFTNCQSKVLVICVHI